MSSRKEFEKELDKLPPRPYKPTADLREIHWLFHKSSETGEGVIYLLGELKTRDDILDWVRSFKITNLQKALSLLEGVERESFTPNYPPEAIKLALRIYLDHNPPDKINHDY